MRKVIVFPGQRVVTSGGNIAIVAFVNRGRVFVYGRNGLPEPVNICTDAFGGEHDQAQGLAA